MSAVIPANIEMVGPSASCAAGAAGSSNETVSIPTTGVYVVGWKADVPTVVNGGGQSSLVVRVRNDTQASNIFLGTAGACNGGQVAFSATAADVISLNLASTAANDLASLNVIKCVFSISGGVS